MPWHLSKSDPRKVYDERHEVVCVCQTPEQAARIVAAVTGKTTVVLREPATPETPETVETVETPTPLETFEPDSTCCGWKIARAARDGQLKDVDRWECPACGCEWTSVQITNGVVAGTVRHWSPKPATMIFRNPR